MPLCLQLAPGFDYEQYPYIFLKEQLNVWLFNINKKESLIVIP